jgi:DNA-binding HxlR family transcriptional regulator
MVLVENVVLLSALLIVRELLIGQRRFGDLAERLSGVSPTVLTNRLNALVEDGLVAKATLPAPYNAQVYELTPVGRALKPAIYELIRWGGHFCSRCALTTVRANRCGSRLTPSLVTAALSRSISLRIKHKTSQQASWWRWGTVRD